MCLFYQLPISVHLFPMPFAVPFGLSDLKRWPDMIKCFGQDTAGGNGAYQIICKFTHKATRILPSLLHNQYIKVVLKTEGEWGCFKYDYWMNANLTAVRLSTHTHTHTCSMAHTFKWAVTVMGSRMAALENKSYFPSASALTSDLRSDMVFRKSICVSVCVCVRVSLGR